MKSKFVIALFLSLILLGSVGVKKSWGSSCRGTASISPNNPIIYTKGDSTIMVTVPTSAGGLLAGENYRFIITRSGVFIADDIVSVDSSSLNNISNILHLNSNDSTFTPGAYVLHVVQQGGRDCLVENFSFEISTGHSDPVLSGALTCFQNNASVKFSASNLKPNTSYYYSWEGKPGTNDNSDSNGNLNFQMSGRSDGCFFGCISETHDDCGQNGRTYLSAKSQQICFIPQQVPPGNCSNMSLSPSPNSPFDPCKNLNGSTLLDCRMCTGIDTSGNFALACPKANGSASCGTWTSLGCIPNDPPNLVGWIITLASGVAGGIAFLLILFGSFQIVTSGGVPEKIAGGKDVITSALIGLLFIFLSVLILKVIGVQILGIPGWV